MRGGSAGGRAPLPRDGLALSGLWAGPGVRAAVHGQWKESLDSTRIAILSTLTLLGAGLVLRGKTKGVLRAGVKWTEERMWLSAILLVGLVIYWLLRFVLDGSQWQLVVG